VLAKVEQDVNETVPNLARRRQRAGVIAAVPDLAGAPQSPVDRAGGSRGEAVQPADERVSRRGLDDEVDVIGLNREMRDAKIASVRARERG
jgi:hypothetical protein